MQLLMTLCLIVVGLLLKHRQTKVVLLEQTPAFWRAIHGVLLLIGMAALISLPWLDKIFNFGGELGATFLLAYSLVDFILVTKELKNV